MTEDQSRRDRTRCPSCGEDNDCGVERGASMCWCFSTDVSREALDEIPDEQRGEVCLCRTCASGERNPKKVEYQINNLLRHRR